MHKGMRRDRLHPPALDPGSALFLDVDGTLLEIAAGPDLVQVPAGLPDLLERRAAERDGALALISGRPLSQLDDLFRPWYGPAAGLHGVERRRANGSIAAATAGTEAISRLRPKLSRLANSGSGLVFEDKGASLALHYRRAPEREVEILAFAERLHGDAVADLRLIKGKMIVELVPLHADKGGAITAFLAEPPFLGHRPVFIGDDATDEDGFAVVNRRGGLAVRVGEPDEETVAPYCLPSVAAVLAWLGAGGNL